MFRLLQDEGCHRTLKYSNKNSNLSHMSSILMTTPVMRRVTNAYPVRCEAEVLHGRVQKKDVIPDTVSHEVQKKLQTKKVLQRIKSGKPSEKRRAAVCRCISLHFEDKLHASAVHPRTHKADW